MCVHVSSTKPIIKFISIQTAYEMRWTDNAKLHDIGGIAESIRKHGLVELPRYDGTLGAIIAGNGRIEALYGLWRDGAAIPRGVVDSGGGEWLVPVIYGIDAETRDMAHAYAIDSNNLVVAGGDMTAVQAAKMWQPGIYEMQLIQLALRGVEPVSVDGDSLDALVRLRKKRDERATEKAAGDVRHGDLYRLGDVVVEVVTNHQFLDIISAGRTAVNGRRIIVIGTGAVRQWEQASGRTALKID